MEIVSSLEPVYLKVIGGAVLCWLSGWCAGKTYHFVSSIFKRASRTS
jgi:hypothetical protein